MSIKKVKPKEQMIPLKELKQIYKTLCDAQKPLLKYDWEDETQMLRMALFSKDHAITSACNFLYNQGVQSCED